MADRRRARAGRALGLALAGAVLAGAGVGGGALLGAAPAPAAQAPEDRPQLPGTRADPDAAREGADDILARPEYQGPDQSQDTIVDRIRRWIADRFDQDSGPSAPDPGNGPAYVIMALVLLGTVAAVAWTVVGARRTHRDRHGDDDVDAEVDVTPLRSARGWAEEAERCERAGDHRGAVRARYRALTATLADRGLVADTPGRTAGEQRDDVAGRAPELVPTFAAVADLFERAWYGAEAAGPADAEAARHLADRALAAAPRRRRDDPEGEAAGTGTGEDR